jgi:hypothetical protein
MIRYLYNPWTNIGHGHARSELIMAKKLLTNNDYACEILSISRDFGDILIDGGVHSESLLPSWLDRGPIFRFSKQRREDQRTESLVDFLKSETCELSGQIVITSARIEILNLVERRDLDHLEFRIRLIEPPRKPEEIRRLRRISRLPRVSLAIETSDAREVLEKLGICEVMTVPPIQGLIPEVNKTVGEKIGLLWPVSFEESEKNFKSFMNSIRGLNAIVRLPGNFEGEATRDRYPGHTYIDRGISEEDFNGFISQIRVAILPHRDYDLRGSGIAAILAGSGATIFSFKGNSFYSDIAQHASIIPLDDLVKSKDFLTTRLNQELLVNPRTSEYKSWTQNCWEEFLFDDK